MTNLRIGHGYDVHRLTGGRALILGGVTIPYEKGLLGHSDADVLTHAVMDALLGAAALGDIGKRFPDSADEFAGISGKYEWCDSKDVLAREIASIRSRSIAKGFCIFCYSSMYDPVTGEENRLLSEEKCAFSVLLRGEDG